MDDVIIKDELIDQRLEMLRLRLQKVKDDTKDNKGISCKQQGKQIGISDSNLTKYCANSDDPPRMRVDNLIRICEYYKVSADYMLGFTSDKKLMRRYNVGDAAIKQMCDYTGLSRKAIEALHEKKDDFLYSAGLNYLLSSENNILTNVIEYIITCLHDVVAEDERYSRLPRIGSASEDGKHFFYDIIEELPQARDHFYHLVTGDETLRERYAKEMALKCVDRERVFFGVYPYISYNPELSAEECHELNQKFCDVDQQEAFPYSPPDNDPQIIFDDQCAGFLDDLRIYLTEKHKA